MFKFYGYNIFFVVLFIYDLNKIMMLFIKFKVKVKWYLLEIKFKELEDIYFFFIDNYF